MKLVRFLTSHRLWNRGETAGFPPAEADDLIASGIAVDPVAEAAAKATAEAEAAAQAETAAAEEAAAKAKAAEEAEAKAKADAEAAAKGKKA